MNVESSIPIPIRLEISNGPSITRSFMDKNPDSFNNFIISSDKLGNKSKEFKCHLVINNSPNAKLVKKSYEASEPIMRWISNHFM